jgi:OOP family OmpA-OmpF porin
MKKFIAVALLSVTIAPAHAAIGDGVFYVGADVGQAKASGNITTGAADTSDTSFSVSAGYQFNRNWAAEAAYSDLGQLTYGAGSGGGDAKTTAISLSGVGIWPLDNGFSLFGKLGVAGTSVDASAASLSSTTDRRTGVTVGVGGQYNLTNAFGIRVAYNRFVVGDNTTEGDYNLVNAGVVYKF